MALGEAAGQPALDPIPEDRDQAFSRYDGYVLDRTRARDPRFQEFGPHYAGIGGLTFNGWDQDRRLLAGFAREDFVEAAKELQARLTDAAIEAAALRMPPEWYAIDGARLVTDLRARRDGLPEVAEKFYLHLAKTVDVYLTDRSERIDAVRTPGGDMEVSVRSTPGSGQPGATTYHRVFHESETDEVRFYALGGDDFMSRFRRQAGPPRAHGRRQGRRHARRERLGQGQALRLGRAATARSRRTSTTTPTTLRRPPRTRPGSRHATSRARPGERRSRRTTPTWASSWATRSSTSATASARAPTRAATA